MKITGGRLQVRSLVSGDTWEEKVADRIYSGDKYEAVSRSRSWLCLCSDWAYQDSSGDGLGFECSSWSPILEPVLSYRIYCQKVVILL